MCIVKRTSLLHFFSQHQIQKSPPELSKLVKQKVSSKGEEGSVFTHSIEC